MMNKQVLRVLSERKAVTGKELRDETGLDEIALWRFCTASDEITKRIIGTRYLRLDRNVRGFARLSPSIKREFLTYTVCGNSLNRKEVDSSAEALTKKIEKISSDKLDFAHSFVKKVVDESEDRDSILQSMVFIIGGDIVFKMAHLEPRPERSTGKMVRGSDLDIVIIHKDGYPPKKIENLDKGIYKEKYLSLVKPDCREEVDYVIKDLMKTKKQLRFDGFESMIASKILWEGQFLYGNKDLFHVVKNWLKEDGIPSKIKELEEMAEKNRQEAEAFLLHSKKELTREDHLALFYTSDESDEIY